MILYPKAYFESVKEINIDFLNKNNIKALILDVDNTILDFDKNIPEGIEKWCEDLKKQGIKFCILSNSNHKEKVQMVAEKLGLPYFYFGTKPLKRGFKKAINLLEEKQTHTIEFTDWNRANYNAVLVLMRVTLRYYDIDII